MTDRDQPAGSEDPKRERPDFSALETDHDQRADSEDREPARPDFSVFEKDKKGLPADSEDLEPTRPDFSVVETDTGQAADLEDVDPVRPDFSVLDDALTRADHDQVHPAPPGPLTPPEPPYLRPEAPPEPEPAETPVSRFEPERSEPPVSRFEPPRSEPTALRPVPPTPESPISRSEPLPSSSDSPPDAEPEDSSSAERLVAGQVEAIRQESEAALEATIAELTRYADERVRAAEDRARADLTQAIAEVAQRYEGVLADVRAELEEAHTAHAAEIEALEAQRTEVLAETIRQHEQALAAVNAQLKDAEARSRTLEHTLAEQAETHRRALQAPLDEALLQAAGRGSEPEPSAVGPTAIDPSPSALADGLDAPSGDAQHLDEAAADPLTSASIQPGTTAPHGLTPPANPAYGFDTVRTVIWIIVLAGPIGTLTGWLLTLAWLG